jgi:hypothetical protein
MFAGLLWLTSVLGWSVAAISQAPTGKSSTPEPRIALVIINQSFLLHATGRMRSSVQMIELLCVFCNYTNIQEPSES